MTDQAPQAPAPASLMTPTDAEVMDALRRAIKATADNGASDTRGAEAKDFGAAALAFAQALTTMDPERLQGGDTPTARLASVPTPLPATKDGDRDGKIGES